MQNQEIKTGSTRHRLLGRWRLRSRCIAPELRADAGQCASHAFHISLWAWLLKLVHGAAFSHLRASCLAPNSPQTMREEVVDRTMADALRKALQLNAPYGRRLQKNHEQH